MATTVATMQLIRKVAHNRDSDHGGASERSLRLRFADGIHGLMGEIIVARRHKLNWTPGGFEVSRGDVAGFLEVRTTEPNFGHLLIYKKDKDASVFALVLGHYPLFRIGGYLRAGLCKRQEWWRANADPPCWWVPQRALLATAREAFDQTHEEAAA